MEHDLIFYKGKNTSFYDLVHHKSGLDSVISYLKYRHNELVKSMYLDDLTPDKCERMELAISAFSEAINVAGDLKKL